MLRGPSVDWDPVLHVLAGSSAVDAGSQSNHVCLSKKIVVTPCRRENWGQDTGLNQACPILSFSSAYNSDRERHTDRDLCSLRSRALVLFG